MPVAGPLWPSTAGLLTPISLPTHELPGIRRKGQGLNLNFFITFHQFAVRGSLTGFC